MGKFYLSVAAGAGLLMALAASADAKGGRNGQAAGQPFTPPGFSHNTTGQTNANWGTNSMSGQPQPPGFSHDTTGQTKAKWDDTLGGVPPGLSKCPRGLTNC
jgi:hypothetical protein